MFGIEDDEIAIERGKIKKADGWRDARKVLPKEKENVLLYIEFTNKEGEISQSVIEQGYLEEGIFFGWDGCDWDYHSPRDKEKMEVVAWGVLPDPPAFT